MVSEREINLENRNMDIITMYRRGMSIAAIAELYELTEWSIRKILKKGNVRLRSSLSESNRKRYKISENQDANKFHERMKRKMTKEYKRRIAETREVIFRRIS